jgi:hypothetical protein
MAIRTTPAGPRVPLTTPVIDLAPLAAGAPGAGDTVVAQNYRGEADTPPSR